MEATVVSVESSDKAAFVDYVMEEAAEFFARGDFCKGQASVALCNAVEPLSEVEFQAMSQCDCTDCGCHI